MVRVLVPSTKRYNEPDEMAGGIGSGLVGAKFFHNWCPLFSICRWTLELCRSLEFFMYTEIFSSFFIFFFSEFNGQMK